MLGSFKKKQRFWGGGGYFWTLLTNELVLNERDQRNERRRYIENECELYWIFLTPPEENHG